ncbi:MAG: mechanosensitive ion channel [Actinobacteria bacterium]|nr:mechanosensitive ion channel [Actinomycetota bacterium]
MSGLVPSLEVIFSAALRILIISLVTVFVYRSVSLFLLKLVRLKTKNNKDESASRLAVSRKRTYTLNSLLQNLLKYFLFFVAGSLILDALGVNLLPFIAGAGIVGVALGFGAQSFVKDVLAGFSMIFEDQYVVGDFVVLICPPSEISGVVEEIGLRITKIRSFDGSLFYVQNGTIASVKRFVGGQIAFNIDIFLPSWIDEVSVQRIIIDAGNEIIKEQPFFFGPPKLQEFLSLSNSNIARIRITAVPSEEWAIEDIAKSRLINALKDKLQIPHKIDSLCYKINDDLLIKYKTSSLL